jgi:hypothetical protein
MPREIFKDRYVRDYASTEIWLKGHSINDIKHVLKANKTDIRRYPKQTRR